MAPDKFNIFSQAVADIISFSENDEFRHRCFKYMQVSTCSELQNKIESKLKQLQGQKCRVETSSDTSANMKVQTIKEPPIPLKYTDLPTSENHYGQQAYTTLSSSLCTNKELIDNQQSSVSKLMLQEGIDTFLPVCQSLLQFPLPKSRIYINGNHDLSACINQVNSQKSPIKRHEESKLDNDQKFEKNYSQDLKKLKSENEREQIVAMDTFPTEDDDFTFYSQNSSNFDFTFDSKSNSLLLNEIDFDSDSDNSNLKTNIEEMYEKVSTGSNNDKKDYILFPRENVQNHLRITKDLKPEKLNVDSHSVIDDKNENSFSELNNVSTCQYECNDFSHQSFKITPRFSDLLEGKETITESLYLSDNINKILESNENENFVSKFNEQDFKSCLDSIQLTLPVDQTNLDLLTDPTNVNNDSCLQDNDHFTSRDVSDYMWSDEEMELQEGNSSSTENVFESIHEELLDPISDYHWSDEIMKQVDKKLDETTSFSEILNNTDQTWSEEVPIEVSNETIVNETFADAEENSIDFLWYE